MLFFLAILTSFSQQNPLITKDSVAQKKWTDSILSNMTLDQKIGQLFMLAAYTNKDKKHTDYITNVVKKYQIGGLIFMQGTPEKQIKWNNKYQSLSKVPLLIAFDGEWGLDMRLKKTYRFPWNMTLGAIRDDKLIEDFGSRLGEQCKRMGIHVNFAPVVDINTNPNNPIIGNRSFGENKYNVANKSVAFTKGLQSQNVLACAKHFPGHGDTETDSHKTLPSVSFTSERIDSVELYPYKKLFKFGIGSVMAAHLSVPSLEENSKIPTSLSHTVLTDLLKNKMQFKGLIFTDALNMKGVSEFVDKDEFEFNKIASKKSSKDKLYGLKGKVDLKALLAGNDVLLFSEDVEAAFYQIKKALDHKIITEQRIDESVRKILNAKYWCGLQNYKAISATNIIDDLNTFDDEALHRKLIKNAITLIKNENAGFPIRDLVKTKIAYVKIGDSDNKTFVNRLKNYTQIDIIKGKSVKETLRKLKPYNLVIIGFHKSNDHAWKDFHFNTNDLNFLHGIAAKKRIILDVFASPYALLDIKQFKNIESILVSYQNSKISQDLSAQIIFGAIGSKGKLPVSINTEFSQGFGLRSSDLKRLSFGTPEEVGMNSAQLKYIDTIAKKVLDQKMAPGMHVLVARHGKIIYRKSYGYHTAKKTIKVTNKSMYDLASVTKILGGMSMIMKAEEDHKFTIDNTLGELMPVTKGSNKDTVTIKEALSHNGRLRPWIPFYVTTLDSMTKLPLKKYYRKKKSKKFSVKVTEDLYLRSDYQDTIFQRIADAPQRIRSGYKYSGFPFYLFKPFLEKHYKKPLDKLNDSLFYYPLGARNLTYNPLHKFKKELIVPTEKDDYYRHQLLQGEVHDMGAAMLGGVNGNAGLFGNSLDIAKMMQMYLQKGYYGGKRYLKVKTLEKFNKRYYEKDSIRRGLGFDKPQMKKKERATCGCVSDESFGHSGFTGTYTWADPKSGILYVFLSNRVYPTMANRGLVKEDIRTKIQQIIQDAIIDEKVKRN
jgi:beta-glucosidase-like glycosyl hydrolase/CubicO group peptidase (beta-lactamase class C family)